jgi:Domain of unknown function (DUF4262)
MELAKHIDEFEKKIDDDIKEHGWHCPLILGDEEGPPFAYSIGLGFTGNWPECVVIGQPHELMHSMIANLWDRKGTDYAINDNEICTELIEGYICILREVHASHFTDYFGRAIDQYAKRNLDRMRFMQVFWPDKAGKFPWEPECQTTVIERQPLLYIQKAG